MAASSHVFSSISRGGTQHIPLVPRVIEELKKNLSPNHVVGGDTRFLQQFTATLYMAEELFLETIWAIWGVFPAPLVKEGSTGELEAD